MARKYTKKKSSSSSTKPKRKYTKKKKVEVKIEEPKIENKPIEVVPTKEKVVMKEEKKLGRFVSSNRFPTELTYNNESVMIPAKGCVPDRNSPACVDKDKIKYPLPLGIRYIEN